MTRLGHSTAKALLATSARARPEQRESYPRVRERRRRGPRGTAGRLDLPSIFERCEPQAAVETFRSSGPSNLHGAAMLSASVAEYDIADVRGPRSGKAEHEAAARTCHDR